MGLSNRRRVGARVLLGFSVAAGLIGLAACGGGSDGASPTAPTPTPPLGAQRFGSGFAAKFNAAMNSDPAEPAANDIVPLNVTTDPLEVP